MVHFFQVVGPGFTYRPPEKLITCAYLNFISIASSYSGVDASVQVTTLLFGVLYDYVQPAFLALKATYKPSIVAPEQSTVRGSFNCRADGWLSLSQVNLANSIPSLKSSHYIDCLPPVFLHPKLSHPDCRSRLTPNLVAVLVRNLAHDHHDLPSASQTLPNPVVVASWRALPFSRLYYPDLAHAHNACWPRVR